MPQFKSINPDIEVNGQTVLAVANGLGIMKLTGLKILEDNGLKDIQPDIWYPQQLWLNAFRQISENVGFRTLYLIGLSIPENAVFPSEIDNIFKALESIDIAYHMNHRLHEKPLYNPDTGEMLEGIGHYYYKKVSSSKVIMECNNPYPCDFDKGIIMQMARKFSPKAGSVKAEHDEKEGCRKNGGEICRYSVTW